MTSPRRYSEEESASIDLTPMLDVVFIMLIFFIVTASFIKEASIVLERPMPTSKPQTTESNDMQVILDADNQIQIDNRRVDHRSLRAYFERHAASNPGSVVIIKAKNGSKTYAVVQISDAARQAGLYKVILSNVE